MECDEKILRLEKIAFSYGLKRNLDDISLEAGRGELIGLMGPNGSGKTTLMRCINGLLHIQGGIIYLDGGDLQQMKVAEIARICAGIPADVPDDFHLSVKEYVTLGRYPFVKNYWWEGKEDEEIVSRALEEFHVTALSGRKLSEVSSGEKARVLLAKGVVQQPRIMLVDEPSAHLDLKYKLQVMESLRDLSRKGVTVITASHDINLLSKYCDKVLLMSRGRIVSHGKPCDVINEASIQDVYEVEVTIVRTDGQVFVLPLRSWDKDGGMNGKSSDWTSPAGQNGLGAGY